MLIALQSFRGERPRVDARELDYAEAQVARNVKLWSGKIKPWFRPRLEQPVYNPGPIKSIYRFGGKHWLHWNRDVDVAKGPIAGTNRLYWTGDGAPRFGNLEVVAGVTKLVANAPGLQNFVLVNDARGFKPGDIVHIELDAGGAHTAVVTTVQVSGNRINLSVPLPSPAASGNACENGSGGYPHGSFLLGVPPPAAPAVAATMGIEANSGNVTGITTLLGEQRESSGPLGNTQTYSIDLENVDSHGQPILFEVGGWFMGRVSGTQTRQIVLTVVRDPDGEAEEIYSHRFTGTVQGGEQRSADIWSTNPGWNSPVQQPNSALKFQFAPAAGAHTYRFTLEHDFTANPALAHISGFSYTLRLTASLGGGIGIKLENAEHGLREGDKLRFAGIVGSGSLNVLNTGEFLINGVDGDIVYVDADAHGEYTSGGTWQQVWDEEDKENRLYVYTYIASLDGRDMEGPPSPAGPAILAGDNQRLTVSGFIDPRSLGDGRPYRAIYLYRLAVGTFSEELRFVAEIPLGQTHFVDTVRSAELGEILPSAAWDPPPEDMDGLISLPNGLMAAFRDNELLLCPPYQPHAWPVTYRRAVQDKIVGIAAFGASIFVGTEGRPVIATGVDPEALSEEHIEVVHPCLSKRGIVDMGYAILYPSKTGLVLVAQGRAEVVTLDLFSDDEWAALNPASFVAAKYGNRYICFYDNGKEQAGFILDPRDPRSTLVFLDFYATEVWSDPGTDELYLVTVNTAGDEQIVKWDADQGGIPMPYRWRSKEFVVSRPTSLSVIKVDAELYPVVVNVYADGAVYDAVEVFDEEPVRLSDKYGTARKWEIEIIGSTEVEAVYAASNVRELVQYLGSAA